jgi:hypothetical protein
MKNSDLLLAADTVWVQNGGTHRSPAGPVLLRSGETALTEAAAGKAHLRRPPVTDLEGGLAQ